MGELVTFRTPRRTRTFDFEPGLPASALARVVRAALEDEGLRLTDGQGARLSVFTIDGVDRVVVPLNRIVPA